MLKERSFRLERDPLGEKKVPADAYYGIQTLRAFENFPISSVLPPPILIVSTAMVKLASARANLALGLLDRKRADAIARAAREIVEGALHDQFIVDAFQAGAGTSHNMNANEVIANRAVELLGGRKGDYSVVHPNDHVNMSQSTNDVMPTALRVAALISAHSLKKALAGCEGALRAKSAEFYSVIKSGRTHLQDAVPVTLGQEFGSYASSLRSASERIELACGGLKRVGLGATAAGTGINTHPLYRERVLKELKAATGIRDLRKAADTFEALSSFTDFTAFSGSMRDASVDLIRIANDLRLLSSGPATGLGEIRLPPVQPGSSIMPGKVNPVMAEMLGMVSFQAIGADAAIAMAAQAGQLELNVMLPVIAHNLLFSIKILTNGLTAFTERCVRGVRVDAARCKAYFEASEGLATVLNTVIGYEKASEVARESIRTGKGIREIVVGRGILSASQWESVTDPRRITRPVDLKKLLKKRRGA